MASADTLPQVDFRVPELIEQGRDNLIQAPMYLSGSLVAPDAGDTVSVYDASNTAIVSAQTITVTASVAVYNITAATVAGSSLGEGWRVVWSLTDDDGVVHTYDNEAALIRRRLFPTVTHAQLYRRISWLDPAGSSEPHSRSDFQNELDESWNILEHRLLQQGRRPWLIVSPSALRLAHLELWTSMVMESLGSTLNDFGAEADRHRDRYEAEWARIRMLYDSDDDGQPEDVTARQGASSTLWTC